MNLRVMCCESQWLVLFVTASVLSLAGCRSKPEVTFDGTGNYKSLSTEIDYPDLHVQPAVATDLAHPNTLREPDPEEYWELTLEEVIQIALANSDVLRDLGGRVLPSPATSPTVFDPSLQQTSPQTGEEAALSDFDARFTTSLFINRDDRSFNNPLFGGGALAVSRTTGEFNAEIGKTAATGTQLAVRNRILRDADSIPLVRGIDPMTGLPIRNKVFDSSYDAVFELEFRHPLLQGGGIDFNRIAGPNSSPGNYNGIMIARVNTDIALADFETGVRDFLADVFQTYWQLYFTYRDLDARTAARDAALESWRSAKVKLEEGYDDILEEALTRDQYYQFQGLVAESLSGVGSGSALAALRPGVYATERQLRWLMGIDINDGRLIRPAEEPSRAELVFDWGEALNQAMQRRVELRRQKWSIRRNQMQLFAARNFLRMRLDLVGLYRWRGFGDDLLGNRSMENGSAFRDLFDDNLQGWQYGVQLSTPIGNRIGHTAVRNAELALIRNRALLQEQERQVSKQLSDSFGDLDRAFKVAQINFNRAVSARQRLAGEEAKYELGESVLQFVLDAQSRVAESESEFFRSLVDYNLSVARVHFSKGTYLDFLGVSLTEGPWSGQSYRSAAKESRRHIRRHFNYCVNRPGSVTTAPYEQHVLPRDEAEEVPLPADDSAAPADGENIPPEPGDFELPTPANSG